jgi:hypothetical protein
MTCLRNGLVAALAAVFAALTVVTPAPADQTQESIFQDDAYLIYSPARTVNRTLSTLHALGVDRIRVNVEWFTIAPRPQSRTRPAGFDATIPADYPAGSWVPYDRLVELAAAHGIGVEFNITSPGPLWAMRHDTPTARAANHWAPNVSEFMQFVQALGMRYSGAYGGIPRVSDWSIWNEPNQPGWLAPQWRKYAGQEVRNSPRLYREYVQAAALGLAYSGHLVFTDTILIGELAPEGYATPGVYIAMTPIPFLQALYCVDRSYRRLTGAAAKALGCPQAATAQSFVDSNYVLFYATGWAHHPYYFFRPPAYSSSDPDFAPLGNLPRLERGLDRIFRVYGLNRKIPVYLTEYGYKTDPPNPYVVVTPALQAAYLNEADYIAWRDARVRSVAQFLLYDSKPNTKYKPTDVRYWSTFQTGLLYANGKRKPAYAAYRLPIWIPAPRAQRGQSMLVWGLLRLAPHNAPQQAEIQWRPAGGQYRTIASVNVTNPEGYLTALIRPPRTGFVRIAWVSAGGSSYVSRAVAVTVL